MLRIELACCGSASDVLIIAQRSKPRDDGGQIFHARWLERHTAAVERPGRRDEPSAGDVGAVDQQRFAQWPESIKIGFARCNVVVDRAL